MFPNNLKERERILVNSEINSKIPKINFIGFKKLKNLKRYPLNPIFLITKTWVKNTENKAKAKVVLRSLFGDFKRGRFPLSVFI